MNQFNILVLASLRFHSPAGLVFSDETRTIEPAIL